MPAALITGSSRGIGQATALRFARDGYDVVVNFRSSEAAAKRTAERVGTETDQDAIVVRADVSDPEDVERLVDRTVDSFGGLDHVVNNAGIEEEGATSELSVCDFDRVMDVNVNSAFAVSKTSAPYLLESDDRPSITSLSSMFAFLGVSNESHYASSKQAILGLTRSLALDLSPEVRVNAIAPGFIDTDMTDHTEAERQANYELIPLGRYGRPEEVADAAAYLRDAGYITGETLSIDGGVKFGL